MAKDETDPRYKNPDTQPTDETLARFPQLARARELFIALFRDRLPLVNLGYTNLQIEFTVPAMRLIEGEGEVITDPKDKYLPYLNFDSSTNPGENANISCLPNNGFLLFVSRDTAGEEELTDHEGLIRLLIGNPIKVIDDIVVAKAGLFPELEVDAIDLSLVVPALYSTEMRLKRETLTTKVSRKVANLGPATFRAAWLDDRTKIEFAVEIIDPQLRRIGLAESDYTLWRRLNAVSDNQGAMTPFGQKPGDSKEIVSRAFSKAPNVFAGALALGKV